MDNRSLKRNAVKSASKSKNAAPARKNGLSAPVGNSIKKPVNRSKVSGSVGMNKKVKKTTSRSVVKKKSNVVGTKRRRPLRAVRTPKIITIRKKEKTPFPTSIVFTSIIITALFLFMMVNYAQIDKTNSELVELDSKCTRLQKEKDDLQVKLDKKDNPVYIEEYAENELGMVKSENLPRNYVSLPLPNEKSEIIKYDDGQEGGFGFLLAGVGEVLNDFLK